MDWTPRATKRCSHRGSVIVEGALGTILFFTIILGLMEFMRLGFTWLTLHHAAGRGARFASLMHPAPDRSSEIRDRVRATALMDLPDSAIRICRLPLSGCLGSEPGDPGEMIEIRIETTFSGIGGLVSVPLSIAAVVTNEPYEIL